LSILDVSYELEGRVRAHIEDVSRRIGVYVRRLEVTFDLKTAVTLGEATYGWTSLIRLNPAYLNTHTDWYIDNVCTHEYCHLATSRRSPRASAHGPEWKAMMAAAGATPHRTYDIALPPHVKIGSKQRIIA
jgi:predicted SprT family Zn-dependent metalloprotease